MRLFSFLLFTCAPSLATAQTVTFLHLNDLHANLVSHMDMETTATGVRYVKRGGLARIATLVKQIRQQQPNTVLMNIGDTYHGGVEATFTNGNSIVSAVNALNIDVGVPGNWDFAIGPDITWARNCRSFLARLTNVKRPNFPNLAANVRMPLWFNQYFMRPTLIRNMNGVKVGFIGLTSDIVPRMHPILSLGLSFNQGEAAFKRIVEQHAANLEARGADIIVVMSELGLQKDYQLANVITHGSVDFFFSAHTHELVKEPLISDSGAIVVESGNDTYLGRMDVDVDDNGTIISHQWNVLPIELSIVEDPTVKSIVDRIRSPFLGPNVNLRASYFQGYQRLTQSIDTVLGQTPVPLQRRESLENDFNNILTDVLLDMSGLDIAMITGFRFESVIPEQTLPLENGHIATGDVTLEDAYRFFPTNYQYATGTTTGRNLKRIIEEGLESTYSANALLNLGDGLKAFLA